MVRTIGKLTALKVSGKRKPGMYSDGGGLYLQVTNTGAKSWIFRFRLRGKNGWMGLGPLHAVSLAEARVKATDCRRLCLDGINPIEARKDHRAAAALEAAKSIDFSGCADAYIKAHRAGWRNVKHATQWRNTMDAYAIPTVGSLPVQGIDTGLVLKILEPIWTAKPETAGRVRGRIESILDWATARGYRRGENPARWRGHLDKLLPARSKVRRVQHHPALSYDDIPQFMRSLRQQGGTAAKALEFLILTVARTGEVLGAPWPELNLKDGVWTVPASRIKGAKEHRVPLSAPALAIVEAMKGKDPTYVFPGGRATRPLSSMALLALLKRMGRSDLTVHGFRSTFRDWAAERTNYPREVAEMALAHALGDKVEAAYRRGDLFQKRRRLMDEWAKHCAAAKAKGEVVAIRSR
jgi:integrase